MLLTQRESLRLERVVFGPHLILAGCIAFLVRHIVTPSPVCIYSLLNSYEINSIKTNKGNNAKGQPEGPNNEKKFNPCFRNPKNAAPKPLVKLIENVDLEMYL